MIQKPNKVFVKNILCFKIVVILCVSVFVFLWETQTLCCSSTSEAQLEVKNGEVEVRWYLSSFAPPYVKVLFSYFFLLSSLSSLFTVFLFPSLLSLLGEHLFVL